MDNPIYDFPIDKVLEALGSRMEPKDIFFLSDEGWTEIYHKKNKHSK